MNIKCVVEVCGRDGSISPLPISIFVTPNIGDIDVLSISFVAALFGLLTYFIITRKLVNYIYVIPQLSFLRRNEIS